MKRILIILLALSLCVVVPGCLNEPLLIEPTSNLPAIQTGGPLTDFGTTVATHDGSAEVTFPNDSGLLGYYITESFEADMNNDGHYEVYVNAVAGSGIVHSYLKGYDFENDCYYILSERFKYDYYFVIFDEQLYVVRTATIGGDPVDNCVFVPTLDSKNHTFILTKSETVQID